MPDNGTVSVDNIIYSSFVKYDRLNQQLYHAVQNTHISRCTNLNIYIDLYSVLKSIFSEHYRTDITDYTAITSGIINMCSHYRGFFKRLSVNTKFYLVFSYNTCDINRKFVAEYNAEFYRKSNIRLFREIAESNFKLLELLCPYLPDIFFIKSERSYESTILMANLIEHYGDGNPNLIISKDLYPMQLCYKYPTTMFLCPIKIKGGLDQSIMVTIRENDNMSFNYSFWNLVALKRRYRMDNMFADIYCCNFPLLSALRGFQDRNIASMVSLKTASRIIYNMVDINPIDITPPMLYQNPEVPNPALVESRLRALDMSYIYPFYLNDPESKSIQLQNLRDDAMINQINAKFFEKNPIDLLKL